MTQTSIFDILPDYGQPPRCRHAVSQRNGGWSFEPIDDEFGLWVHADPECGLPKHHHTQSIKPPEIRMPRYDPWMHPNIPDAPITIAIDPGDVHAGMAFFADDDALEHGQYCYYACEVTPEQCTDIVAEMVVAGRVHTLIFERFRLYGDKSEMQKGSEFLTSQMIGVLKWICRHQNEHAEGHAQQNADPRILLNCTQDGDCKEGREVQTVRVVGQMADIKKPAFGRLRRLHIRSWAKANTDQVHAETKKCADGRCHAVDAEVHGWFWKLNSQARAVEEEPRRWVRLRNR